MTNIDESQPQFKQALLVILHSENGRDGWAPLKPADVPAWVSHPDKIARMVEGDMISDPTIGDKGSGWYRAEVIRAAGETQQ